MACSYRMCTNRYNFRSFNCGYEIMTYLVLDTETESKTFRGRNGSPFVNKILCIGYKWSDIEDPLSEDQDYIESNYFNGVDLIIMHNAKYDLLHLWKDPALHDYFKRGGKIYCSQLAEYMLSGQQYKYPKLRDIAVNIYGCKERVKNLDQYKIGKILDTTLVPIEELLEDVENDVLDTEQVYLGQQKSAKEMGMTKIINAMMDGLLATTEIEYNGMYINREVFNKNKLELEEKIKTVKINLLELAERYWK